MASPACERYPYGMNRREALTRLGLGAAGVVLAGCDLDPSAPEGPGTDGRLLARPLATGSVPTPGLMHLGLDELRDAVLYVPETLPPGPAPLVVALHGDPGSGDLAANWFRGLADDLGFLLLAPSSRGKPWDAIVAHYGPDVRFIDTALRATFERCDVDPARIGLSGFSAGASYAIALGRTNGDFFRRVVAFAPAFLLRVPRTGRPEFFLTHGVFDSAAPIAFTSEEIVPLLREAGYTVRYEIFDGGHVIPPTLAREAFTWMVGP